VIALLITAGAYALLAGAMAGFLIAAVVRGRRRK
jgi:hypothetical protein